MTTQEQLKIFAAYLPYDLLFENTIVGGKWRLKKIEKRSDGYVRMDFSNTKMVITSFIEDEDGSKMKFKPILYDLSHLTKEIEHEGERFVPIVELLKLEFPNQKGRYAETDFSADGHPSAWFKVDAGKNIRVDVSRLNNAPYWMVRKLLSWHYNVFGIPAGDFIDKSTLKTESNE